MVLEMISSSCAFIVKLDIHDVVRLLVRDVDHADHVEVCGRSSAFAKNHGAVPKYRFLFRIAVLPGVKGG